MSSVVEILLFAIPILLLAFVYKKISGLKTNTGDVNVGTEFKITVIIFISFIIVTFENLNQNFSKNNLFVI